MKKDAAIFLTHIIDSIKLIEVFVEGLSKSEFLQNIEKQYAVVRGIEIISEAAKNIPPEFRKKYPKVRSEIHYFSNSISSSSTRRTGFSYFNSS